MDGEIGGLGGGRRADIVLLNDDLEVRHTWYGGIHVVADRRITPELEAELEQRYEYPARAKASIRLGAVPSLLPPLPTGPGTLHAIRTALPGIVSFHAPIALSAAPRDWPELCAQHDLCYLAVLERYGQNGGVGRGVLQNFGLRGGAVASSVGHDSHNLVVAGDNEADMRLAIETIRDLQGGVCVVKNGDVKAVVRLPIAGLLSDQRAPVVAAEMSALKREWNALGCTLPFMGFNLLPLSVIPEFRLTDKGLVSVNRMALCPLFDPA